jgi:hypothetical protein
VIDQLAIDYADKNIVFVDYTMNYAIPNPVLYRYEVIERTEPGWGLTWTMVDSGQRYSRGVETEEEAVEKYTAMVEYGIAQEALADISAQYWVIDDTAFFKVTVQNLSGVKLSQANTARVYAFVKETGIQYEDTNTTHHASRGEGMTLIPDLADQETGTYYVSVPLRQITDWNNVSAYAFVDYETSKGGLFKQLNATEATKIDIEPTLTVGPTRINLTIPDNLTEIPPQDIRILAGTELAWVTETNRSWISVDVNEGVGPAGLVLYIDTFTLRKGNNRATLLVKDLASDSFASVEIDVLVEKKATPPYSLFIPLLTK